ncbi:MAG: cytochrome c [Nitrospira sp.]|nr:cytochrome c [Nitrospira sp.]MBH0185288.1 cytochrome c [Nitrospira sp.]
MRSIEIGFGLLIGILSAGFAGGVGLKGLTSSGKGGDSVSGREIYVNTCIRCHGIDGTGVQSIRLVPAPADLSSPVVQNRLDGTLFKRIHEGKPNTAMGAWKHALSDEEIWDVLAYVRTLGVGSDAGP